MDDAKFISDTLERWGFGEFVPKFIAKVRGSKISLIYLSILICLIFFNKVKLANFAKLKTVFRLCY